MLFNLSAYLHQTYATQTFPRSPRIRPSLFNRRNWPEAERIRITSIITQTFTIWKTYLSLELHHPVFFPSRSVCPLNMNHWYFIILAAWPPYTIHAYPLTLTHSLFSIFSSLYLQTGTMKTHTPFLFSIFNQHNPLYSCTYCVISSSLATTTRVPFLSFGIIFLSSSFVVTSSWS